MTKCAICRDVYAKWSMSQKVCGKVECAQAFARKTILKIEQKARKVEAKANHQRKMDLQPRRYWVHKAKLYFHRYIRMRDKDQPCISCGATLQPNKYGGSVDAGHFRSVGSAKHLQFNPMNVHAQCKRCNRDLSGNHSEYRKGLIERIGMGNVEWLESNQTPLKLSINDLKKIISIYKNQYEQLK